MIVELHCQCRNQHKGRCQHDQNQRTHHIDQAFHHALLNGHGAFPGKENRCIKKMNGVGTTHNDIGNLRHQIHANVFAIAVFQQVIADADGDIPKNNSSIACRDLVIDSRKSLCQIHAFHDIILVRPAGKFPHNILNRALSVNQKQFTGRKHTLVYLLAKESPDCGNCQLYCCRPQHIRRTKQCQCHKRQLDIGNNIDT